MQIKKRLLPSEFTKNTIVLIVGTVVAQAIPLLIHPFLRRIYSAEDFGAMAVFLSLFSMVTIVAAFRYESTIVLPKNDNEAANILGLTFLINLCFNTIIFFVLVFFKTEIVALIGFPLKYANYLYFLPFTSFLFSAYQSMNYWLIRQKAFKASSFNKIVRRSAEGIVQVILGVLKFPGGLFVGDIVGNFSNVISGIRQVFKNKFNNAFVTKRKMGFVAKKYMDYPKFNMLPTLLSSAATLLPFLFINKLYSTEIVGYLDLSRMVLSIPLIFISTTISQVLFQKITESRHQKVSILIEIRNVFFLLLSIIFIEAILLYFFGDFLFGLIFGAEYVLSSTFSKILIISFSLNFISSTFSSIFLTFDKIRLNSIWQVAYFLSICSLLLFKDISIESFLKTYVTIEAILLSTNIILIFFIVKKYETEIKEIKA